MTEPDEDEGPDFTQLQPGASFFLEAAALHAPLEDRDAWDRAELADALVCESIWNMFAKKSNGDGYDARSRQSIVATKYNRAHPENRLSIMPRSTMGKITEDVRAQILGFDDQGVTHTEIGKRLGIVQTTVSRVCRQAGRFKKLRADRTVNGLPLAEAVRDMPIDVVTPPRPSKRLSLPSLRRPAEDVAADPIVAELERRRDEALAKYEALDRAIDALRGVSVR